MNDETVRLVLDLATSSADVHELAVKLEELKAKTVTAGEAIATYATAATKSEIAANEEARALDKLTAAAVAQTQARKAANQMVEEAIAEQQKLAAAVTHVGAASTTTTSKSAGMGQTMLQTSYAFQDFTSQLGTRGLVGALGAVQNNIPNIVAGIGGTAGMAGAISVVAVGLGVALPLLQQWGTTLLSSHTKTEAEAMKELEDNTSRTADQTERLNKFKKEQAELQKILISQSHAQQEEQRDMEEFFAGQGKQVLGGIAGAIGASGRGAQMTAEEIRDSAPLSPQEEAAMNDDQRMHLALPGGRAEEEARRRATRSAARDRVNAANVDAAGKLLGRAPTDKGARDTIRALAGQNPGAFPKGFANDMASMEPEAMARRDAEDEAFQAEINERSAAVKRRNSKAKQAKVDKEREKREAHAVRVAEGADERATDAASKADDRELQQGIKAGREAGKAAAKLRGGPDMIKGLDLGHIPLVPEHANLEQAAQIMDAGLRKAAMGEAGVMAKLIENQGQLSAQQLAILQQLQRSADNVGASIQSNRSVRSTGFQN